MRCILCHRNPDAVWVIFNFSGHYDEVLTYVISSNICFCRILYTVMFSFGLHSEVRGFSCTHLVRHSSPSLFSPLSELLRRIALIFLWSLPPCLPFLSPSFLSDPSSVRLLRQIGHLFSISTHRCDKKGQFWYVPWEVSLGADICTQTNKRVMGSDAFDRAFWLVQKGKASSRRGCSGYF